MKHRWKGNQTATQASGDCRELKTLGYQLHIVLCNANQWLYKNRRRNDETSPSCIHNPLKFVAITPLHRMYMVNYKEHHKVKFTNCFHNYPLLYFEKANRLNMRETM